MIQQSKYYLNLTSNNCDIQQQYLQNIHDDEIPKQYNQMYNIHNPIDVKYGFKDKNSLLFKIDKKFPQQPDIKIGVDLIYLIDINQTLNEETLEKIKYALKQLINYLSDHDRLCIIVYNNKADKLFPLIPLTEKNRQLILQQIEQINLKKGKSNIMNAVLVANLCLKLRQFKNQITSVNIISQDEEQQQYSFEIQQFFEKELVFKVKFYLLLSNKQCQSFQQKKNKQIKKHGRYQIVDNVDQLSSFLCYQMFKLQQTIIVNLLIIIKTHQFYPIQISECEGGKFRFVNQYEIQISKNSISIGYDKVHLISIQNNSISEVDKICEIEVSFQQVSSNQLQKYFIPIYTQVQNGIIDDSVILDKYKLKSRSQMKEALLYYDPYRIQDCIEVLKKFLFEVQILPDNIKQQLSVEIQQFDDALSKYNKDPFKQIENPFIIIDDLIRKQKILSIHDY